MSKPFPPEMTEAARLTKLGRLSEATTLLQRLLKGDFSGPAGPLDLTSTPLASAPHADSSAEQERSRPQGRTHNLFTLKMPGASLRGLLKRTPPRRADIVPEVGEFLSKSFKNDAGGLTYKLYIPSGSHGTPRPLIVMLHGCTQSADDFAAGTRMNFAADEHAAFVAYPEQAASANASRCWNWFRTHDQQRDKGEPSLIAGIAREVMAAHNIDPKRVYIAGLSAGGAAAAVVAEAYPDLFAAVGVHSGLACGAANDLPSAFAAMSGQVPLRASRDQSAADADRAFVPTIVFHGDRDTTVHSSNGAAVIARADINGDLTISAEQGKSADGHEFTRKVQRAPDGQVVLEEWVIHGAGHAWSGGCVKGSFTDPKGPDATKEMLRFFLEHSNRAQ